MTVLMTIFHCESWTGRFYLTHWLQVLQRSLLRLATRNRQNVICMQELCNNCVILGFFFRMTWIVRNTEDQGDRGSCEGDKDFGRWCHTRFGEGHACIGCSCRCFGKVGQEIHRGGGTWKNIERFLFFGLALRDHVFSTKKQVVCHFDGESM